ncbi:ParA family protein [Vibrio tritonius]|uniref:ParA family protein n=1 Tax=Vibrio tritonius TaxID=1435069 RepID=A0ABS7YG87_9VIBR|nr:ParA family protein [Vibrio tritonius]MCA2014669.1 ParA family protein [Vibrio tritonius]
MTPTETHKLFHDLSVKASEYVTNRNSVPKVPRNFTQAEVKRFLNVKNAQVIERALQEIGVDPRAQDGARWLIDIDAAYKVRSLLGDNARISPKFTRKPGQKLQVICVQNQKGGVGKTITASNLGSCLAIEYPEEYRIGLIDTDPQRTLTLYYLQEQDDYFSVGDLIQKDYELENGETEKDVISNAFQQTLVPNLRILPAHQRDRGLENWFHREMLHNRLTNPYGRIKEIIEAVEDEFDIIIIDTPPSTCFATLNAYLAATSVIFPIQMAENDIDATCGYFQFITELWALLEELGHPGYDFVKLLITNYAQSKATTETLNDFSLFFGQYIYPDRFNHSEAIKECAKVMSTISDMSKSEYPGRTKKVFENAETNIFQVTSQIYRDIRDVWFQGK